MNLLRGVGRCLARYINRPVRSYKSFSVTDPATLAEVIRPGDVLLVEGDRRVSAAIKYLTQSTWSHAALYVGGALGEIEDPVNTPTLVEADIEKGVIGVPLAGYAGFNTRICRPVKLTDADRATVINYVTSRRGQQYDLKNIIDLARYLLPTPPVPGSMRRRMIALGSGDPTRAICSSLIAQAFQSVRYPILPHIETLSEPMRRATNTQQILHIRHHSLFAPSDFDISPYFQIIKPTIEKSFDYRELVWGDLPLLERADPGAAPPNAEGGSGPRR